MIGPMSHAPNSFLFRNPVSICMAFFRLITERFVVRARPFWTNLWTWWALLVQPGTPIEHLECSTNNCNILTSRHAQATRKKKETKNQSKKASLLSTLFQVKRPHRKIQSSTRQTPTCILLHRVTRVAIFVVKNDHKVSKIGNMLEKELWWFQHLA